MVPVHVAEHDGAGVRLAVEEARGRPEKIARKANAGTGVDYQARALPVVAEGDAGGVAAVALEVRPGVGVDPRTPHIQIRIATVFHAMAAKSA